MRRTDPLILGAGPAGCAAAIALARAGASPLLLDRDRTPGDALCGGFLSWRTLAQLESLGLERDRLGGHTVDRLRLFAHGSMVEAPLPARAMGLSRRALDTAMRDHAIALGTEFATDTIRTLEGSTAIGQAREWRCETLFLATGKHDVRGQSRPRDAGDPAMGLRIRLPASQERDALLAGAIELHLFDGGYAGIVLQEDASANLCLALRKSALRYAGAKPQALLAKLCADNPDLAQRMGQDWEDLAIDTIGAVPYGFIAEGTSPGLYRLGDQAAVIPSLAGEGIGIALASGQSAAAYWLAEGASGSLAFQSQFAAAARRPVRTAALGWRLAEHPLGQRAALALGRIVPALLARMMDLTRIR